MDKTLTIIVIIFLLFIAIGISLFSVKHKKKKYNSNTIKNKSDEIHKSDVLDNIKNTTFSIKPLISNAEKELFFKLKEIVKDTFYLGCQINLASIINKNAKYANELFRNIDFGIFDKNTFMPIVLIELNDSSHKKQERYKRDLKVREILKNANIPLITLYTDYNNTINYIIKKIVEIIPDFLNYFN